MKNGLRVISILFSLILFLMAVSTYDSIIDDGIYIKSAPYQQTMLVIEDAEDHENPLAMIHTMEKLADEHNVTIFQNQSGVIDKIIYLYTKDQNIIDAFKVVGNRPLDFSQYPEYSTRSSSVNNQLLNPIDNNSTQLVSLDNINHPNYNIKGTYEIISRDFQDLKDYMEALEVVLSDYQLEYSLSERDELDFSLSYEDPNRLANNQYLVLFAMKVLIITLLLTLLLSGTKKINIMLLEGFSSKDIVDKIIRKEMLNNIFTQFIVLIFSYILFVIRTKTPIHEELIVVIVKTFLSLLIVDVVFYVLLIIFISFFKINEGIKGKSNLSKLDSVMKVFKIIIIIVLITPLLNTIKDTKSLVEGELIRNERIDIDHNLYQVAGIRHVDGNKINKKEKEISLIREFLIENSQAFAMDVSLAFADPEFDIDPQTSAARIIVDDAYLNLIDIEYERPTDVSKEYILTSDPEGCHDYDENYTECEVRSDLNDNVIHFGINPLISEDSHGYLWYPQIISYDEPIELSVINEEDRISNLYFYYDGTIKEAQEYLDQVSLENGLEPVYLVDSIEEISMRFRQYFISDYIIQSMGFLIVLCSYFIITLLTTALNVLMNDQKYKLFIIEGYKFNTIALRYLQSQKYHYLIIGILIKLINKCSWLEVISMIVIILLIDHLLMIKSLRRIEKRGVRYEN